MGLANKILQSENCIKVYFYDDISINKPGLQGGYCWNCILHPYKNDNKTIFLDAILYRRCMHCRVLQFIIFLLPPPVHYLYTTALLRHMYACLKGGGGGEGGGGLPVLHIIPDELKIHIFICDILKIRVLLFESFVSPLPMLQLHQVLQPLHHWPASLQTD